MENIRKEALEIRRNLGLVNGDILLAAILNELIKLNEKIDTLESKEKEVKEVVKKTVSKN